MNRTEWDGWMRRWLIHHPLKEPPAELQKDFRKQVMARIQNEKQPFIVFRWLPRHQLSFALGGVMAAALAVAVVARPNSLRLAQESEEETLELWNQLEQLEELPAGSEEPISDEELLEELQQLDESELTIG